MESRSCLLLVPRCYGFGTVLDSSDGWFQGESPADRLPGCPCAELEGELREQEESERTLARCFKQSDLDPPTGGWSNQSVRMGRSPACTRHLIFHSFRERYTQVFISVVNIDYDAKV